MQNNLLIPKKCGVIILAAGISKRMGIPKLSLTFNNKHSFLEEIIHQYKSFKCKEMILVLNPEGKELIEKKFPQILNDCNIVVNFKKNSERFYSIKLGIQNLTNKYPVFIQNVDNPFINTNILKNLFSQDCTTDYIAPTYNGRGGHPILISNEVCQDILSEQKNNYILSDFLKQYKKKKIAVDDEKILVNINTEYLYRKYFR